jgi:hypothetical protein
VSAYTITLQQWLKARGTSPALSRVAVMAADPEILTHDEDHTPETAARAAARQAARMGIIQRGQVEAAAVAGVALIARWESERVEIPVPEDIAGCPDAVSAYRWGGEADEDRARAVLRRLENIGGDVGRASVVSAPSYAMATDEDGVEEMRAYETDQQRSERDAGTLAYYSRPEVASAIRWAQSVVSMAVAPHKAAADAWVADTETMPMEDRIQAAFRLPIEVKRVLCSDRRIPKPVRRACA